MTMVYSELKSRYSLIHNKPNTNLGMLKLVLFGIKVLRLRP